MEFMTKIKTLVVVAAPAVGENLNFLVCLAGDRGLGNSTCGRGVQIVLFLVLA